MSRWAAIALGFSIPISVALDNVLLVVVLAAWVVGGAFRDTPQTIRCNGVALAAIVLYGLLVLGSLYGSRNSGDTGRYLVKYVDLLFIPVFLSIFSNPVDRARAIHALAASLALTLALSFLLKAGVLPKTALLTGDSMSPSVFKLRLTHNILMAFGAFLFVALALEATTKKAQFVWALFAALATVNVTLMVDGATGYLILGALALLLAYGRLRWVGVSVASAAVVGAVAILLLIPGPFQQRIDAIGTEIQEWQPGARSDKSSGQRLEFYRNSLALIKEHPVIGTGTGSFPAVYAAQVRGTESLETPNPHNEYLLIAVQLGVAGLASLFWLFWQQWRTSRDLASSFERQLARGLVITMVIGCMLNSLLLDHTEGLLYAWLTGVLYGGLKSAASPTPPTS